MGSNLIVGPGWAFHKKLNFNAKPVCHLAELPMPGTVAQRALPRDGRKDDCELNHWQELDIRSFFTLRPANARWRADTHFIDPGAQSAVTCRLPPRRCHRRRSQAAAGQSQLLRLQLERFAGRMLEMETAVRVLLLAQ
jgi:hypothetical protein